ncbi:MAG TPA: NADH-quinone oxidoreductase subunit N [Chitinophagaceae bacterium]|nr:NADH-quinone oxidoreductase subunit N [Chitinophagaceae bacterium]HMU58921.1 NADH-quinone oxidoreductase subunit N [Chitinophagaceae bacterium]
MNEFLTLMKTELALTAIIFFMLIVKISGGMANRKLLPVIHILLLLNFALGFFFNKEGNLFGDMFYTTPLIALQKNILNFGVYLISLLFCDWMKRTPHLPEFVTLMLAALLGMDLMISSANMLIFYLSLELATIPVAAMASFDLDKKRSSEGAMKMILSSAFSSGVLLFGISLLYGTTGTVNLPELSQALNGSALQIMAFVFFFAAFAFKLSVVPFHLWTADVYEGSPFAVTAFLSVISKGAVAFIFITMLYYVFQPMLNIWYMMLVILAIITMVTGNLFALRQQNIKRFLAFSSIAQVGFILVGISSYGTMGVVSTTFFIIVYIFSNLAAFGVASVISEKTGKEKIDDYKGLYQTNPYLTWVMALALFSLAGIPPTAGFFGKLFLLTAGASQADYWFILVAALNMIVSLYYYLKVVRAMFMDKNENPIERLHTSNSVRLGLIICSAGIVLAGLMSWIFDYIKSLS